VLPQLEQQLVALGGWPRWSCAGAAAGAIAGRGTSEAVNKTVEGVVDAVETVKMLTNCRKPGDAVRIQRMSSLL